MGCKCGSQIILCNLPVRFDTYRGCSHGCRYCFAQKKNDISHIERDESVDGLRSFIEGKRGNETEWCDWNIPIHWGGMSDPFGPGEVNGGKLRQCVMLVNSVKNDYKSLLTYCSIHSPQAPITAAVARANGMPCRIVYGGTTRESVAALPMPRLAMKYGASIVLAARSGRHSILHARAKELAAQENSFIVQYGINIIGYGDTLLTAVAAQTENLPDDIENLVMTCGSGITATGVMIGLHRYGKRVKRMHLVATAPDRRGFIHETLKKYGADREFEYHDLFHSPGFVYEKPAAATWGGIRLHPHYEAKTMQWFRSSGIAPESTLFWITGAEPRSPGQS